MRTTQSHLLNIFFNSTVKPDPPQNVTIESKTSRTITISWTSGFDGNSEITSYTVEISDNGLNFSDVKCQGWSNDSCTVSGLDTNATLEGLLPYTTYFLRVFAVNKVDQSDASSEVHVVTDEEGTSLFYYLCEVTVDEIFVLRLSRVSIGGQILLLVKEGCRNFLLANKYHSKDKILKEMTRRYRI